MLWFIIISLLVLGLALLVIEVVFIPGTTVVGILGVISSIVGVVMAYNNFGNTIGFYVLLSSLIATGIALYFSFKSGAWTRFSNKSSISGKVNEGTISHLKVGDIGVSISALRPFGKAEFHGTIVEARSAGNYVEPQSKIRIVRIDGNQVLVDIIT